MWRPHPQSDVSSSHVSVRATSCRLLRESMARRMSSRCRIIVPILVGECSRDSFRDLSRVFVFPRTKDEPTVLGKRFVDSTVSFNVFGKLGHPVAGIGLWRRPVVGAPMPKATVDENGNPRPNQRDVDPNRPAPVVEPNRVVDPEAEAKSMESRSDTTFGACIPPTISLHDATTRRRHTRSLRSTHLPDF